MLFCCERTIRGLVIALKEHTLYLPQEKQPGKVCLLQNFRDFKKAYHNLQVQVFINTQTKKIILYKAVKDMLRVLLVKAKANFQKHHSKVPNKINFKQVNIVRKRFLKYC